MEKEAKYWIIGALVFFPAIGLLSYCAAITHVATAPARVVSKTMETNNIIQNYEWFKQQYQDISAIDARIAANQSQLDAFDKSVGSRDKWTFEDKQEHARLTSVIAGLQGQRADMVAAYNARSQMTNRAIFKTHDLPVTVQ